MSKKRWGIPAFLCLGIAAYFIGTAIFALWNGRDFASETPQFVRYVAVPAIIAAGFVLCALFAKPDTRAVVAASSIAILGGMFAFELVMTARSYSATAGLVSLPDIRWMRSQNVDESLPPSRTAKALNTAMGVKSLPNAVLGGIPGKRVYLCSSGGKPVFYQADRFGFNNPEEAYGAPVDIMVVGDSFVEGICLKSGQDLVGQLRATGPATVGVGNRGAGPVFELAALGRYGPELRPRTVVLAFFEGNDWENLEQELQTPYLRQALSPDAEFGSVDLEAETLARAKPVITDWQSIRMPGPLEVLQRTNSLRNLLALQKTSLHLGIAYPKAPPAILEYNSVLARTKAVAAGWGGRVILLYIPLQDRFMGLVSRDFVYDQVRSKVLAAADQNDIPVIDLAAMFKTHPKPQSLYGSDAHFSALGASVAASAVADFLRKAEDDQLADRNGKPHTPSRPAL